MPRGLVVSDSPGLQHPLGIEAVHFSAGTGTDLVVRVAGRWRRRRPASTVPPVLAVDTEHQRYRFPALREPPSVRGWQAGLWQVRFTIPASLAPYLGGRLMLMLGSTSISLPPAVADPGATNGRTKLDGADPGHDELARLDARRPDAAPEAARGEARALSDELELELTQARRETERLGAALRLAERKRREAEQLAHSEAAMRIDLGRDHAARIRRHQADTRAVLEHLEAVQIHAHRLTHEIDTLRRAADEASRIESSGPPNAISRARALAVELAIARSTPPAPAPAAAVVPVSSNGHGHGHGLGLELAMQRGLKSAAETRVEGALLLLAAERSEADELVTRGPAARGNLARDRTRAAYVTDAIDAIGRQLEAVRAVVALLPEFAPEGGDHDALRAPRRGSGASEEPAGSVAPDRLAAALYRLREERPPSESEAAPPPLPARPLPAGPLAPGAPMVPAAPLPPGAPTAPAASPAPAAVVPGTGCAPWLLPTLKRLLREDPALVGSVVIQLLPAQSLTLARPVRYDLVLSDLGCLAVTVGEDAVRVEVLTTPRPLGGVDFRLEGDLAGLGRLLLYGAVRRRLSRRVARVRGDRRALTALDGLVREPFSLLALYESGVRLEPALTLTLAAHMIDPSWTAGERFTVGYESSRGGERVYLAVRDGARPRVTREPPLGPVTTTIRASGELLLALLAGGTSAEVGLSGAYEPVALLRKWIARAQRDS
jgi:hypothetical protein